MAAIQFPELLSLVSEIKDKASSVTQRCRSVKQKNAETSVDGAKGISLLDAKVQLLLSYLGNVSLLVMMKLEGQRVEDHPVVKRLVELRTVLEKIRPIDQKLKYQIDKLLKMAAEPTAASTLDPLRARPNPANLVRVTANDGDSDGEDDDDDSDDDGVDKKDSGLNYAERDAEAAAAGLYVPPRIAAMHYDGEDEQKKKKKEEGSRYGLNRFMLQELRDEYHDGPEEQVDEFAGKSRKRGREEVDQMRYEEDHLIRLPGKKKKTSDMGDGLAALHDLGNGGEGKRAQKSKGKGKGFDKKGGKKKSSFKRKRRP